MMGKFFGILLLSVLVACVPQRPTNKADISTGILPFRYLADRLTGDSAKVFCLLGNGDSHGSYTMKLSQVKTLSNVKIYFSNGFLPFEDAWYQKILSINKNLIIHRLDSGITLINSSEEEEKEGHNHDECGTMGVDPHYWCSPKEMKIVAENMYEYLKQSKVSDTTGLTSRYHRLASDLDILDRQFVETIGRSKTKLFLIFHPSLSYLARDYGLTELAIEVHGGKPSPAYIKELIDKARAEGIKTIMIQRQYDKSSAKVIANEIGARLVEINPLGYNYISEMQTILNALTQQ